MLSVSMELLTPTNRRARRSLLTAIALVVGLAGVISGPEFVEAQRSSAANTPEGPRPEMLTVEIKVVNEQGKPIRGARIVPEGLRARAAMGHHYSWMADRHGPPETVHTDDAGSARVSYPRYVEEQRSTGAISFTVTHPDFVGRRPHGFRVDGSEPPLTLVHGGRVRVTGLLDGAPVPPDRLWAQVSAHEIWYDDTSWSVDGDALLLNQQIPAKMHLVQAAYMPAGGPLQVSDARTIDARAGEAYDLQLELKECARLEGRLDKSIPRPIQNGRVVIMISPAFPTADAGTMFWETWRDVRSDGTFVFESLPPGRAEITALCDGYRSTDGAPREWNFVHPQVHMLSRGANEYEIAMTPTATADVTVLKPDGRPLPGAEVWFQSNTKWLIGTTTFAQRRVRWEEFVPGVGELDTLGPELISFRSADFRAITDENGLARVVNLVDGKQDFVVVHDDFATPIQPDVMPARRVVAVDLIAGETASTSVTMEPSGATSLDNTGGGEILGGSATKGVEQKALARRRGLVP